MQVSPASQKFPLHDLAFRKDFRLYLFLPNKRNLNSVSLLRSKVKSENRFQSLFTAAVITAATPGAGRDTVSSLGMIRMVPQKGILD